MNFLEAIEAEVERRDRASAMSSIRAAVLNCIRQEKVGIDRALELVRAKTMEAIDDPAHNAKMIADLRVEEPQMSMGDIDAAMTEATKSTIDMMNDALASAKEAFESLRELVRIDESYDRKPIV
jgi:hypothetical protein